MLSGIYALGGNACGPAYRPSAAYGRFWLHANFFNFIGDLASFFVLFDLFGCPGSYGRRCLRGFMHWEEMLAVGHMLNSYSLCLKVEFSQELL